MRDYKEELEKRVNWIKTLLEDAHANGIIYGNSGGKDSALVGILCKKACDNTVGIIMPCASARNYGEDSDDANDVAKQFDIETRVVDLTKTKETLLASMDAEKLTSDALKNINPRLRMTTLYAIGQSEGRLVAGTGNKDELYVGYYTKYGDGGADFNPIADLTVGEVYEFLEFLDAPLNIRTKAPSAGLEEGQTDEGEMGILYSDLDKYLNEGEKSGVAPEIIEKIERMHKRSLHKITGMKKYGEIVDNK